MPLLILDLVLTILLEWPIHRLGIKGPSGLRILGFGVLLNGFTLPLAQGAIFELGISIYIVEAAVPLIEALVIKAAFSRLSWGRSFLIALVANAVSWGVGTLLYHRGVI